MKRIKRLISLALATLMAVSLMVPASAADEAKEALYAQYQQMINEANLTYGYELSVLPLDAYDTATMPTAEEFQLLLTEYCVSKMNSETQITGESFDVKIDGLEARPYGTGPVTRSYVAKHTYSTGTVSISFTGTFNIAQSPTGPYYVNSYAFLKPTATSTGSSLYYVLDGDYTVQLIDGGETYCQTQNFFVYANNAFYDTTTVSAFFYFDKTNGTITADGV